MPLPPPIATTDFLLCSSLASWCLEHETLASKTLRALETSFNHICVHGPCVLVSKLHGVSVPRVLPAECETAHSSVVYFLLPEF